MSNFEIAVKSQYERMYCNKNSNLPFSEMLDKFIAFVKFVQNHWNRLLHLSHILGEINSTFIFDSPVQFSYIQLVSYCRYMGMNLESVLEKYSDKVLVDHHSELGRTETPLIIELIEFISRDRFRMLERMRIHRWYTDILFGFSTMKEPDFDGDLFYEEFDKIETIKINGMSFYYDLIGETTVESLLRRYEKFELLCISGVLSLNYSKEVRIIDSDTREDIAKLIMYLIEDQEIDPRHVITPVGLFPIINSEISEEIFNLSMYDSQDLYSFANIYGIEIEKGNKLKLDECVYFALASEYLSKQFYSTPENHRDLFECINAHPDIANLYERGEFVLYGHGDGISKYLLIPIDLLASDLQNLYFRFRKTQLKRLKDYVIPSLRKFKKADQKKLDILSEKIDQFNEFYCTEIISDKDYLIKMFNIGQQFYSWIPLTEISTEAVLVIREIDPYWEPETPSYTERLRNLIFAAITELMKGNYPYDSPLYCYGNLMPFCLGEGLEMGLRAVSLGMFRYIRLLGKVLRTTSMYYLKEFDNLQNEIPLLGGR